MYLFDALRGAMRAEVLSIVEALPLLVSRALVAATAVWLGRTRGPVEGVQVKRRCEGCQGTGNSWGKSKDYIKCSICKGRGWRR